MTNTPRLRTSTPKYADDMERSPSDAAVDSSGSESSNSAISVRLADAETIARSFTADWAAHFLHPVASVDLDTDAYGEHLFVFSLDIDYDVESFDPAVFPSDRVAELTADLRSRLQNSSVGRLQSLVSVGTKVGAARR